MKQLTDYRPVADGLVPDPDRQLWAKYAVQTPHKFLPITDPDDLLHLPPGSSVKSQERAEHGFPEHHGRIAQTDEKFVVIGHGFIETLPKEWIVWEGNYPEFARTWRCD